MGEGLVALAVCLPESTDEVSKIMKICHEHDQTVVVYGGLTNLVGSTEVAKDDLVISMERLDSIEELDEQSRTVIVQAGVVLEEIHSVCEKSDLLFPLNFGAKGTAQIGGIISTNAGGLRVFRFGMTRNLVLGLEVVLSDGTIISSMKKVIKDNSGYDLKQLFIGSEGTLGIVTKAILKLSEKPKSRVSAYAGINNYKNVVDFLRFMDSGMSGILSGYELLWGTTYQSMTSPPTMAKPPLEFGYEYYVLVEGLGSNQTKDNEKFEKLLADALESGLIEDAVIANTASDMEWFWKIREDVHAIVSQCTFDQHFDISMPIANIGFVVDEMIAELKKVKGVDHIFIFGHVADGNIHFIIGKDSEELLLKNRINDIIYAPLKSLGGSVSAEHGIGVHKKEYLKNCRSEEEIELMKLLKRSLDPKLILNRGKILDLG